MLLLVKRLARPSIRRPDLAKNRQIYYKDSQTIDSPLLLPPRKGPSLFVRALDLVHVGSRRSCLCLFSIFSDSVAQGRSSGRPRVVDWLINFNVINGGRRVIGLIQQGELFARIIRMPYPQALWSGALTVAVLRLVCVVRSFSRLSYAMRGDPCTHERKCRCIYYCFSETSTKQAIFSYLSCILTHVCSDLQPSARFLRIPCVWECVWKPIDRGCRMTVWLAIHLIVQAL